MVVLIAAAGWWLWGAGSSDCSRVHEMLEASTAGTQQLTEEVVAADDVAQAQELYGRRIQQLREVAEGIGDPSLRATAVEFIELDESLIGVWSQSVGQPLSPDTSDIAMRDTHQHFVHQYQRYVVAHDRVVEELLAVCPKEG